MVGAGIGLTLLVTALLVARLDRSALIPGLVMGGVATVRVPRRRKPARG